MSFNPAEYYITKYALSDGIRKLPREQCQPDGSYLWWRQPGKADRELFRESEFYPTQAEAKTQAIAMAKKRIATSQKAITKMERLITEWEGDQ